MSERFWTRRIILAGASAALIGGGVALPATAMAAPTAAPQQAVTLPQDSADGIGVGGNANAENTTVGGTARGGGASTAVGNCEGGCTVTTGAARGGNASADAVNTGDATAVGGNGHGTGGTVTTQDIKQEVLQNLKAKLAH
ncbi:hypothetical protein [Streptomyces sp. NBC_00069]|uniref:hypothetical protein n=1 Tax=Streptomyces sp. NBC_00069 TaxID=2975639 RepID=UPI00324B755F